MLPMGNHQLEGFAQIRVIGVGGGEVMQLIA